MCIRDSHITSPFGTFHQHTRQVYHHLSLIYFLAKLRSNKVIAKPHSNIDLHENLENGAIIPVTKFKTNQFRERIHEFPLAAAADSILCPVKAIMGTVSVYGRDHGHGIKTGVPSSRPLDPPFHQFPSRKIPISLIDGCPHCYSPHGQGI